MTALRSVDAAPAVDCPTCSHELLKAVASGSVLDMLLTQRRLMAAGLVKAEANTQPQFNQALNKLHELIAAEQERLATAEVKGQEAPGDRANVDEALDPSTV